MREKKGKKKKERKVLSKKRGRAAEWKEHHELVLGSLASLPFLANLRTGVVAIEKGKKEEEEKEHPHRKRGGERATPPCCRSGACSRPIFRTSLLRCLATGPLQRMGKEKGKKKGSPLEKKKRTKEAYGVLMLSMLSARGIIALAQSVLLTLRTPAEIATKKKRRKVPQAG